MDNRWAWSGGIKPEEDRTGGLSTSCRKAWRPASEKLSGRCAGNVPGVTLSELERSSAGSRRCVITGQGKRGKVELHFHSEDELARLVELLGYQAEAQMFHVKQSPVAPLGTLLSAL